MTFGDHVHKYGVSWQKDGPKQWLWSSVTVHFQNIFQVYNRGFILDIWFKVLRITHLVRFMSDSIDLTLWRTFNTTVLLFLMDWSMKLMGQELFSTQWKNTESEHVLDDQAWSSNYNFIIDHNWSGHELKTQWYFAQIYYPGRFFFLICHK